MSSEIKENLKQSTGLNWMDALAGVGTIGGTAASVVTQQVALATVPLSCALLLQIFSRQQKVNALVEAHESLSGSVSEVQQHVKTLAEETTKVGNEHQTLLSELAQENNRQNVETITLKECLEEHSERLTEQTKQLSELESTIDSIKEISAVGIAKAQFLSAEAHLNRGSHQEKLGHLEVAIDEYTQAINQSQNYAHAYLLRGQAKASLGRKQSAVIDLNLATKYFFEEGDLANYQKAKGIASNLHKLDDINEEVSTSSDETADENELVSVSVSGLFD